MQIQRLKGTVVAYADAASGATGSTTPADRSFFIADNAVSKGAKK